MHTASRPRSPRLPLLLAGAVALTVLAGLPARAEDGPATGEAPAAGDTVVGELVQAWAEYADAEEAAAHADAALLSWVAADDGTDVLVDSAGVGEVPVGATVEVTLGGELPAEPGGPQTSEPVHEVVAAEVVAPADPAPVLPASAPYTNEVTVVLAATAALPPDGTTAQQVVDAVNGPVAAFWETQSNGAVRINATAARSTWVTANVACDSSGALWNDIAGQIGWTSGPGKHLLLYVPRYPTGLSSGCAYGLAQVRPGPGAGGALYVRGLSTSVIAHELGHNFGLGHASAVQCDGSADAGPCRTVPYWDLYDVMGVSWQNVGSLGAPHAARLNVLPSSAQQVVPATGPGGTYTLAPMGGRTGLRVLALDTGGTRYWVEYRSAVGQDAWLDPSSGSPLDQGVLVRVAGPGPGGDTSLLLDGTPSAAAAWDEDGQTTLAPGDRLSLAGGQVVIEVTAASPTGATIAVRTAADATGGASPITVKHSQMGGDGSRLGPAVGTEFCGLRGGGCWRAFQGGFVHWSPATGAQVTWGAIRDVWGAYGWENGRLGYPVTGENCGLRGGGCWQAFQGGYVHWSPASGARVTWGAIRDVWGAYGWENGRLGYPLSGENCGLRGGGCWQAFQGGYVHWSPASGARVTWGAIRDVWGAYGWEGGRLGYPLSGENCGLRGGGCWQAFQGGSIHWSPASGARVTWGAIRDVWGAYGWEGGRLGYPLSGENCGLRSGGCYQAFQGGSVHWSPATGARVTWGAIRDAWAARGWESGRLGYPTAGETCSPTGCRQDFQGGVISWNAVSGIDVRFR
ncbi:hypothetical protein [Trujillonella humicola]|uniref:hypothetical protein n=1 Tax=Trujillonella humicola TaxID=3383699 RepID=UPI0039058AEF